MNFKDLPPGVPALAEALKLVPDIEWLLEIKTYPPEPEKSLGPALMVARVLAAVGAFPLERLRVLAFDWAVLREMEQAAPEIRRICLTSPVTNAARGLWWGPQFEGLSIPEAVALSGAQGWAAYAPSAARHELLDARRRGLEIFAWTVNEAEEFNRIAPLVDGIITDYPSRFLASPG